MSAAKLTTLPDQMRQTADLLDMISRLYGEDGDARWSAAELRNRAAALEAPIPGIGAIPR